MQQPFIKGTGWTPNYNAYPNMPCLDADGNIVLTWTWRYLRIGSIPGWLIVTFNPDGTVRDKIAVVEQADDDGEPN